MKPVLIFSLLLAACSASTNTTADAGAPREDADTASADSGADVGGRADSAIESDMRIGRDSGDDATGDGEPYMGVGDPYQAGELTVTEGSLEGAPTEALLFAPAEPGRYPLVVFHHGFLLRNSYYSELLRHVASHGFVVLAPQMYEPTFIGAPTAAEEAVAARELYDWASMSLAEAAGVDVDVELLGLAGHSRGAKVVWLALEGGFSGAVAAAGVDPVDGTGGPLGTEPRVLDGGLTVTQPSLFIGTELGSVPTFNMACAPEGDNHIAFFDAASSPATWALAEGYGHLDMLDDDPPGCGVVCTACEAGPADGAMRAFTAGLLVAFFRERLQGAANASDVLTGAAPAPIGAQFMTK